MKINWTNVVEIIIAMVVVTILNRLLVEKLAQKIGFFTGGEDEDEQE